MEVKKYDKIILDSTRSIDDIVASIKAELSKQESQNAGESYICYVSHAYSSGQNAGVNYIVVSDDFKRLNRLSSNVIKASSYTKDEINELIAKVDAKIPVDEAKLAKQNELKGVEADILGKEQSIPAKRQELLTLSKEKRALEANLATITELINEKEQAGENTEILQAQKRQYESDIATKSSQITNLEREINQLNSDIEVLNQTKERLKSEEALIQSPELATKKYVDELKTNLQNSTNTINTTLNSVVSDTFEPFYQIKNNPYGLKEIVLGQGGDTTDPAEAVRMGMKYKAFRITIKGEVTGNLSISTPTTYAEVLFYYDSNSGTTGILNGNLIVSNCKCRIVRLNLNNGLFLADRNAYVNILSNMNIIAPSDKAALNISGSIVFSDQTTGYRPKPWVLNSNFYGISLDNYGRFIAGRNLEIQTTNTIYKVFCNRGSVATMTGTKLSGDGTDFNIALNTPTASGLILR